MKQINQTRIFLCLLALLSLGIFQLVGNDLETVNATNAPQTLPFSQNWTNTNLITANDDWSGVPGIIGYLGDIAATSNTNVDPRTLLADYSTVSAVDVIANQTNPDTQTTGGVAEFEIANPVVALQGSGTADAPHIVIHLNTTGRSNIRFVTNIRDVDGSTDDAVQQVDVQYRVGGTGDYVSVPGGYIADATTANSATQVTPLNLTLPANANNQSLLQIRVMTTNAVGSDEWVGIDDISVTGDSTGGTPTPTPRDANVDFNGDGKSDWVVTRKASDTGVSQITWHININGTNTFTVTPFGLSTDVRVPEDFDGDGKDDIAVWRGEVRIPILPISTFCKAQTARFESSNSDESETTREWLPITTATTRLTRQSIEQMRTGKTFSFIAVRWQATISLPFRSGWEQMFVRLSATMTVTENPIFAFSSTGSS